VKRTVPVAWLITGLVAAFVVLYAIDYFAYPDLRSTLGYYALLDIAMIPINVLIVGLFLNRLLAARERAELLTKMNMAIGAFFSQAGTALITQLCAFDTDTVADRPHMIFTRDWTSKDFKVHRSAVCSEEHPMDADASDILALRDSLEELRPVILGLLQNGNLLEHGSFSDMLWALSHLTEELSVRCNLSALSPADKAHIELDMARAYGRLLGEWLLYVCHLKTHYPFLFSFVVRTNPFDPDAKVEVCAL